MAKRLLCLVALVALAACGSGERPGVDASPSSAAATTPPPTVTLTFEVTGNADKAGAVLRARAAALGLEPSAPLVVGTRVTFLAKRRPTRSESEALARAGNLTFRPVLQAMTPGAPGPTPAGDCGSPDYRGRLAKEYGGPEHNREPAVACDVDGTSKYLVGPAELTGVAVARASAELDTGGTSDQWTVLLELRSAKMWADVTEKYVGQQLAIVLDGLVQSVPTVNEKILDGVAQIGGSFDESEARALAAVLQAGALPQGVTVTAR